MLLYRFMELDRLCSRSIVVSKLVEEGFQLSPGAPHFLSVTCFTKAALKLVLTASDDSLSSHTLNGVAAVLQQFDASSCTACLYVSRHHAHFASSRLCG